MLTSCWLSIPIVNLEKRTIPVVGRAGFGQKCMKIKMSVAHMVVTENISVQDPYSLATLYLKLEIESKRGEMHFRIAISISCT